MKIGHPVQKKHTHTLSLKKKWCPSTLTIFPSLSIIKKRKKERGGGGGHTHSKKKKWHLSFENMSKRLKNFASTVVPNYKLFKISELLIKLPALTTVSGHLQHWCIFKMSIGKKMSDRLLCTKTRLSQVLRYQLCVNVDKTRGTDRYCWLLKWTVSQDKPSNTRTANDRTIYSAKLTFYNRH